MPALPWKTGSYQPAADEQLQVLTTKMPLTRYRDVPRFIRWTLKIQTQLATAPGCVGYTFDGSVLHKTFWTLSAWSDGDALQAFVRGGTHSAMLADLAGRVGNPGFADSKASTADIPLTWAEAHARLG